MITSEANGLVMMLISSDRLSDQQQQGGHQQRPDAQGDPQGDAAELAVAGHNLGAARHQKGHQQQDKGPLGPDGGRGAGRIPDGISHDRAGCGLLRFASGHFAVP